VFEGERCEAASRRRFGLPQKNIVGKVVEFGADVEGCAWVRCWCLCLVGTLMGRLPLPARIMGDASSDGAFDAAFEDFSRRSLRCLS